MWICLLLLCYVQFTLGITTGTINSYWKQCPTNCSCSDRFLHLYLDVDCQGRLDTDPGELLKEMDLFLSDNQTYNRLAGLGIFNSSLTQIPPSICRLTTLSQLRLDNNQLTRLPDNCLTNLSSLVFFTASNNAIETLQDGVFDGLKTLVLLQLGSNRISSVGSSVFTQLPNLLELHLDNNRLTQLPENCLKNLSSLLWFSTSDNAIETLQDGVLDGPTTLWIVDLRSNRISSIGLSVFAKLSNLRQLRLDNNQLTRLPKNCLSNLTNLINFTASNNEIETLPDGTFDGLTKLKHLDLSNNRISSIGLSVFATSSNLSKLRHISLKENNLTVLEPWIYDRAMIGSFQEQVTIDLSYNDISKFTNRMGRNFFSHCERCNSVLYTHVNLRRNNIQRIEDIVNGWQLNVDVRRHSREMLTGTIQHFTIDALYNDILCDCTSYSYYKRTGSQNVTLPIEVGIYTFSLGPFVVQSHCRQTKQFTIQPNTGNTLERDHNLFVCEITERCPARCVCVHRTENSTLHVYCSSKNLTVLPLELPELPDSRTKYKLDFSNNKLLRRLEYRDYFFNTSILDVSNCSVDDVRDWEEIFKIPDINLSGNKITSLPQSIQSTNITNAKLNFANNPWDCSCDRTWMIDFFRSIEHRLTHKVDCYAPHRLQGKSIIESSVKEFCVDPASVAASEATKRALITSLSSVTGVVVVLLSVGVILYRLRVKLYTRWKFHPFDRDECVGEDMDYDVFLSCSSNDESSDGNSIREQLVQCGYRVCYPPTDFLPGQLITENMHNAVVRSKRTVCLLTENFCQRYVTLYWLIYCVLI